MAEIVMQNYDLCTQIVVRYYPKCTFCSSLVLSQCVVVVVWKTEG